jgi:hypothetical protein
MDLENSSIKDKLVEAFVLAHHILMDNGIQKPIPEKHHQHRELLWAHADCLWMKYAEKMFTGQCSLQASLDFDVEKFENSLDKDIILFGQIKKDQEELCN